MMTPFAKEKAQVPIVILSLSEESRLLAVKSKRWILQALTGLQNDNVRLTLKINNDDRVSKKESTAPHCHSERSEESILFVFKKQKDKMDSSLRLRSFRMTMWNLF
jgi:hypothetical protein